MAPIHDARQLRDRRARRIALTAAVLVGFAALALSAFTSSDSTAVTHQQFSSPARIRAHRRSARSARSDGLLSGVLRAPGGPYLYDRFGRVAMLHGVNAVYKRAPFALYPAPGKPWNFTAADARSIAGLGFNVVRLGILWQGIEPGSGGPNNPATCTVGAPGHVQMLNRSTATSYLDNVTRTVDLLGRYHVYTLLDMHQDVYNQAFRGEGAPSWAVCTDNQPIIPLGGRWSHNYRNPALRTAETHFWLNDVVGNLQGQFDQSWAMVAHHFANNRWIVGYDPYNEPYAPAFTGTSDENFAIDLECFYTGRSHPGTLDGDDSAVKCPPGDPSQGLIPTIEAADPHHLVFVEPDNFSVRHQLPSLLGRMDFPNLVYNFHAYCGTRSPVTGDPTNVTACGNQVLGNMAARLRERSAMSTARQPGGPAWFMSEFGATQSVPLLDAITGFANGFDLGWAYWSWKYYDDPTGSSHEALAAPNGQLQPTADVLARPYAQAIAGAPISTSFAATGNRFQLVYAPSSRIAAPTVIFVPGATHYPFGFCTSVTGGHVASPPGASHVLIEPDRESVRVSVDITSGRCP